MGISKKKNRILIIKNYIRIKNHKYQKDDKIFTKLFHYFSVTPSVVIFQILATGSGYFMPFFSHYLQCPEPQDVVIWPVIFWSCAFMSYAKWVSTVGDKNIPGRHSYTGRTRNNLSLHGRSCKCTIYILTLNQIYLWINFSFVGVPKSLWPSQHSLAGKEVWQWVRSAFGRLWSRITLRKLSWEGRLSGIYVKDWTEEIW